MTTYQNARISKMLINTVISSLGKMIVSKNNN